MNPPPPVESPAAAVPQRPWRRFLASRWFPIVVGLWVVIFGVSGWIGIAHSTVTDREQTTVAAARPYVDQAVARLATAAASDGFAVVAVSAFEEVGSCRVSVFRQGQRFERDLVAVVAPGSERALMDRVASALPASYHPIVRTVDPPRLTADAGYYVAVTGTVVAPGEVRFVADTGDCRAPGAVTTDDQAVPTSDPVRTVLDRLQLGTATISTAAVSCVDGGAVGSVQVRAAAWTGDLTQALAGLPDATVLVNTPRLYAYRTGDAQVAVRAHDDATFVTVTTVCQ